MNQGQSRYELNLPLFAVAFPDSTPEKVHYQYGRDGSGAIYAMLFEDDDLVREYVERQKSAGSTVRFHDDLDLLGYLLQVPLAVKEVWINPAPGLPRNSPIIPIADLLNVLRHRLGLPHSDVDPRLTE